MGLGEEEKPMINILKPKDKNEERPAERMSLIRILNGLPGEISQIKNMEKVDMFEKFTKNLTLMREILVNE